MAAVAGVSRLIDGLTENDNRTNQKASDFAQKKFLCQPIAKSLSVNFSKQK